MTAYIFFKYLHLISVFTMVACLTAETVLIKPLMLRSELKRLSRIDGVYGICAVTAVTAGLTLWFGVGKGAAFYNNPVLHVKVGLVIIVGLISILPTVYFIKNAKGSVAETTAIPAHIRKLVILQLAILAIVPLLAAMIANGLRF